jgi:hypothetical protein
MKEYIILGPVLIPNQVIERKPNTEIPEPHYIKFSEETILEIRRTYNKEIFNNKVTINHQKNLTDGVYLKKSFILDDLNRNNQPSEFRSLPNGTWMIEYSVENEEVYNMIKEGKINGFSIEGHFSYIPSEIINVNQLSRFEHLNQIFDDVINSNTEKNDSLDYGHTELEIIKEWKSKNGYLFNIYSNDHLINKKPHFHFDHKGKGISCKISFSGEIFECKGIAIISSKIHKKLKLFLKEEKINNILINKWNEKNPKLNIERNA